MDIVKCLDGKHVFGDQGNFFVSLNFYHLLVFSNYTSQHTCVPADEI